MTINRRDFVRTAAGLAALGFSGATRGQVAREKKNKSDHPRGDRPILISSGNGVPACNRAFDLIQQGAHPLDAVVAGINVVENDPDDHSVGYGGLPNENGLVELDSCVMDGPTHKAGGVAGLRNIRNPSSVAVQVMRRTDHVLLVGVGALRFAKAHGFKEQELLTDEAREIWLKWKESHSGQDDWIRAAGEDAVSRTKGPDYEFTYGTISCMALTSDGDLAGCTSTSGLSYKIPGRVGDSPIIGAGLYVDNEVGACGSTGRGEANLQNCSSFMIVEFMRQGMTPNEAALAMLKRVARKTEPRLRNKKGEPNFGLTFYAMRKDGLLGGASMHGMAGMAVHDGVECKIVKLPALYESMPPAVG